MTLTTEACDQYLVVLFDVVQATVTRYKGRYLLAVLNELNPNALANGGVRLFGFNPTVKDKDDLITHSTSAMN